MQIFHAGRVELDLCGACGGVWLDRNALEDVASRMLADMPRESDVHRLCACCREPLTPIFLEGEQVESCQSCRGIFLDKGEIDQLAMRRVSLQGPAVTRDLDGALVTFQCPGCGGEFPANAGLARGRALVCEGCAPRFGVEKPEPGERKGLARRFGEVLLGDTLSAVLLAIIN